MAKLSKAARDFISMKIEKNVKEGYTLAQSIAISYSQARAAGYKVPAYHGKHRLKSLS